MSQTPSCSKAMNSIPAGGECEDVEVIVLDEEDGREVFDSSLEDHMRRVSLRDHDYIQRSSKQVRPSPPGGMRRPKSSLPFMFPLLRIVPDLLGSTVYCNGMYVDFVLRTPYMLERRTLQLTFILPKCSYLFISVHN